MKTILPMLALFVSTFSSGQAPDKYAVVRQDMTNSMKFGYVFVTPRGDTVLRLDTAKYYICFSDTIRYFAIVGIRHKYGWWAIDLHQRILFQVYNTSSGEPSPDELTESMIRIVDDHGKIGYANSLGQVIIKPQFQAATRFYQNRAIIGMKCKEVLWCCKGEDADKHYVTTCGQTGWINKHGVVHEIGNLSLEQMKKKLNWKEEE